MGNVLNKKDGILGGVSFGQQQQSTTPTPQPPEHRNTVPLGLYPTCEWDPRAIRRLIVDKKLAPIFKGAEEQSAPDFDECPICFYVSPRFLFFLVFSFFFSLPSLHPFSFFSSSTFSIYSNTSSHLLS
jgi:hypothetical protein